MVQEDTLMKSPWSSMSHHIEHPRQAVVNIPVCCDCPLCYKCCSGEMSYLHHKSCHHVLGSTVLSPELLRWSSTNWCPLCQLLLAFQLEIIYPTFMTTDNLPHSTELTSVKSSQHVMAPLDLHVTMLLCQHVRHLPSGNLAEMHVFLQDYMHTS